MLLPSFVNILVTSYQNNLICSIMFKRIWCFSHSRVARWQYRSMNRTRSTLIFLYPESSAWKGHEERMTCSVDSLQRSSNEEEWILWRAKRFHRMNGSPKLDFGAICVDGGEFILSWNAILTFDQWPLICHTNIIIHVAKQVIQSFYWGIRSMLYIKPITMQFGRLVSYNISMSSIDNYVMILFRENKWCFCSESDSLQKFVQCIIACK